MACFTCFLSVAGQGSFRDGADGDDLCIRVPVGTIIRKKEAQVPHHGSSSITPAQHYSSRAAAGCSIIGAAKAGNSSNWYQPTCWTPCTCVHFSFLGLCFHGSQSRVYFRQIHHRSVHRYSCPVHSSCCGVIICRDSIGEACPATPSTVQINNGCQITNITWRLYL